MPLRVAPLPAAHQTPRPAQGAKRLTVVLPWDLDASLAAFPRTPREGQLLVLETRAKLTALPFHRQKLTMLVSALRHFVVERRAAGFHVEHRVADDYATGITQFMSWSGLQADQVHAMKPREWAIQQRFRALGLHLHDDGGPGGHFLISREAFGEWAEGRQQFRMDHFYSWLRRRLNVLVDDKGKPEGGQWSFDAENRGHARGVAMPQIPWFTPDDLTRRVMSWVAREGVGQWGKLEPFGWPVTRAQALSWLSDFVKNRLSAFGDYEDAIRSDERFLHHSLLSAPLNLGLLRPDEVIAAVLERYERGLASLASTEGFVRQVLGWREFMRGMYWHLMPKLREANQLGAHRPLPSFFWHPERATMRCMADAIGSVHDTGYTHHIERLMVLCNYATLSGLDPRAVSHWFWAAFVDAYEWVELPNVVGMAMYGTDAFTTKPYIASGAYIRRQSGMPSKGRGSATHQREAPCASCRYDSEQKVGPKACPFNALYWDFMATHRERLAANPRMRTMLGTLDRFGPEVQRAIHATAEAHRASLEPTDPPWVIDEDAG